MQVLMVKMMVTVIRGGDVDSGDGDEITLIRTSLMEALTPPGTECVRDNVMMGILGELRGGDGGVLGCGQDTFFAGHYYYHYCYYV